MVLVVLAAAVQVVGHLPEQAQIRVLRVLQIPAAVVVVVLTLEVEATAALA